MLVSKKAIHTLILASLTAREAFAFAPQLRVNSRTTVASPAGAVSPFSRISPLSVASTDDNEDSKQFDSYLEQAKLRQAVRYLREHPDTTISRERWDSIFSAIEERTLNAQENTENLRMEFPLESEARQEMTDMYNVLQQQKKLALYGAIPVEQPLAAGGHELPPELLEKILDLPMTALTPKPTNSLLIAGIFAAVLEGLISITTGISLNALVLLTISASLLDRLFLNGAVAESILKVFSPGVQDKILRHEAGHFLAAYLLGCPVEGIVLSAWAALQDRRFGSRQVSAGTSFFDPELSQQINSGGQQLTRKSIDRYSIIVMAGIAAEADYYGGADGGAGDEMALVAFLSQLNGNRPGVSTTWNSDRIRNQARWGALQAVMLLREYKPAYNALVDALERGGSLGDCIYAIEKAARDHNLSPLRKPLGYLVEDATGKPSWTTEEPKPTEAVPVAASAEPAPVLSEEESLSKLREYRVSLEKKLQDLEQQINDIN